MCVFTSSPGHSLLTCRWWAGWASTSASGCLRPDAATGNPSAPPCPSSAKQRVGIWVTLKVYSMCNEKRSCKVKHIKRTASRQGCPQICLSFPQSKSQCEYFDCYAFTLSSLRAMQSKTIPFIVMLPILLKHPSIVFCLFLCYKPLKPIQILQYTV